MHTDHSPDCATPVEVLLETARDRGLGAIAITDHNEVSGALEARRIAEEMGDIKVIVAEEVKTAEQGEVIGLFLEEKIPRGMTMEETIAEIRAPGRARLRPPPLRPLPLGPRLRAPARHRRGDRHPRGLQPAGRADLLQRGGRALRPQVPDRPRRRVRQPRRPGPRQRQGPDPRLRRAGGVPRGDARRRHHPQAQEPRLRPGAEAAADDGPAEGARSGRSPTPNRCAAGARGGGGRRARADAGGPRERSRGARSSKKSASVPATDDEIREKYLERAIRELNQLTHELQDCPHCPRGNLMPVLGSGPSPGRRLHGQARPRRRRRSKRASPSTAAPATR